MLPFESRHFPYVVIHGSLLKGIWYKVSRNISMLISRTSAIWTPVLKFGVFVSLLCFTVWWLHGVPQEKNDWDQWCPCSLWTNLFRKKIWDEHRRMHGGLLARCPRVWDPWCRETAYKWIPPHFFFFSAKVIFPWLNERRGIWIGDLSIWRVQKTPPQGECTAARRAWREKESDSFTIKHAIAHVSVP